MQLPLQRLWNTIQCLSFLSSNLFEPRTYSQVRRQDQISSLANIVAGMANNLCLGSWYISYGFSVIWITEDDNYVECQQVLPSSISTKLTRAHGFCLSSSHHFRSVVDELATLTMITVSSTPRIQCEKKTYLYPAITIFVLGH
jgi:hypothetical protein